MESQKQRIVVKLGTSTLTAGTRKLSHRHMLEIVRQAAELAERGHQVVIVSSGAIAAGREALDYPAIDKSVPGKQMLAAVGQGRLIQVYADLFALYDRRVGQVLLTRGDLNVRTGYLNARDTLLTLLSYGVIPIVNENDTIATEEIKVGDNDNLSALVANLIDADLLILLTDQRGLFTADPRANPAAQLIPRVEVIDEAVWALAGGTSTGLGTGGMVTKLQAAQLAARSGTTTVIASGKHPNVLIDIIDQGNIGTTFPAQRAQESRKRWLLAEKPQGIIRVDAGAADRLRRGGASLLPVGVRAIEGEFERGAPVQVAGPEGARIAAGLTNYTSSELRTLIGVQSGQIGAVLGYTYGDEAIHRDNLVLL